MATWKHCSAAGATSRCCRPPASGQRAHIARQAAERAAINHPIQGTAADIIKIAMTRLYHALQEQGYQARMLLQVHDELVLEVPHEELAGGRQAGQEIMEGRLRAESRR